MNMQTVKRKPLCSVVIKTHNSDRYIHKAIASLERQTVPADTIVIMDSASQDPSYLSPYANKKAIELIIEKEDVGFCKGNNIGMSKIHPESDYVLFLNPDAFLTPRFLEEAIAFMENPQNHQVGVLTGSLLGYDIEKDRPTGKYDSTGIFQKWYGRWYDRDQQRTYSPTDYVCKEFVPAICGALMFCRKKALDQVLIRDKEVFDNSFFMYKEDIDLSLRLRKAGWLLVFDPSLLAYHCRGWNPIRSKMPRKIRLYSAKNELRLHWRQGSIYSLYSSLKYLFVKVFDK